MNYYVYRYIVRNLTGKVDSVFLFNEALNPMQVNEIYRIQSGNIVVPVLMHHVYSDSMSEVFSYAINKTRFK